MAQRARDVTYVGWFEIVVGICWLLLCAFVIMDDFTHPARTDGGYGIVLGLLFSLLGFVSIIAGNLLLRLRPVGRLLSLGVLPALLFFVLAISLPAILRIGRPFIIGQVVVILVPVLLVTAFGYWYALLRRPHVRAQFINTAVSNKQKVRMFG